MVKRKAATLRSDWIDILALLLLAFLKENPDRNTHGDGL